MKFSIQHTADSGATCEVCQLTFDAARFDVAQAEEVINAMITGLEATSTNGSYFFFGV